MPILTRILAPVGALAMAIALFVPYQQFDGSSDYPGFSYKLIDFSQLNLFYLGLDVLVAAGAAAAVPFLLRGRVLCGSVLITLGTLSCLSFIPYIVVAVTRKGRRHLPSTGRIVGLVRAWLSRRVSSRLSRRVLPSQSRRRLAPYRPCNPPVAGIPIHPVQPPSDIGVELLGALKPDERRGHDARVEGSACVPVACVSTALIPTACVSAARVPATRSYGLLRSASPPIH